MFKSIIFECGVIHVCSSFSTCEIIFWMVKGVIVTKENSLVILLSSVLVSCNNKHISTSSY